MSVSTPWTLAAPVTCSLGLAVISITGPAEAPSAEHDLKTVTPPCSAPVSVPLSLLQFPLFWG